jgi:hypothetical protein
MLGDILKHKRIVDWCLVRSFEHYADMDVALAGLDAYDLYEQTPPQEVQRLSRSIVQTSMPSRVVIDDLHAGGLRLRGHNQTTEAYDAMHKFVTSTHYIDMRYEPELLAQARADVNTHCLPLTRQMQLAEGLDLSKCVLGIQSPRPHDQHEPARSS